MADEVRSVLKKKILGNRYIKKIRSYAGRKARENARVRYRKLWEDLPIDENCVLIESQQGRTANGNMFYIVEELRRNPAFNKLNIWFVVKSSSLEAAEALFDSHGIDRVNFVVIDSDEYVALLASAKFLITDTAFPIYYMPKDGQVVWNTWHGTPLKNMGKYDENDLHKLGNVQKNLFSATYLTFANEHSYRHMVDSYMLEGICEADVLFAGYPRNGVFFDEKRLEAVRKELSAGGQRRLYAYMPTWRPLRKGVKGRFRGIDLMHHLLLLDDALNADEVMYVSVHPLERKFVSFDCLKHIEEFPAQFETYEVLGACDVLVTDYSSVFFDFAVTRKKIVQFLYDRFSYEKHRGLALPIEQLPFPKVDTIPDLITELRAPKNYDDKEFVEEYCKFDGDNVTRKLCETVFLGTGNGFGHVKMQPSAKEKVLIYPGNLAGNGITTSLTSLLKRVDTKEKNYFLTFPASRVEKTKDYLKTLPEGVSYIPYLGKGTFTLKEDIAQRLFARKILSASSYSKVFSRFFENERKRIYGDLSFQTVIQFNGYDDGEILMFEKFPARRIIFAHNDMKLEEEVRGIARHDVLAYAYQGYDKVAVVSEGIVPQIKEIAGEGAEIRVVPNTFDHGLVRAKGALNIEFDDSTQSNVSQSRLERFYEEGDVIVSVGRFSPEKQHKMLIDAFNKVWLDGNESSHLVIVGGVSRGTLYEDTCEYVSTLPCRDNVALILNMSNPFPVVRKSCGFILPSKYEGFGLVLLEADALGKPVVSTDLAASRTFIRQHGGSLVENSSKGIEEGVRLLLEGEAPLMNVDYDEYDKETLDAFFDLWK